MHVLVPIWTCSNTSHLKKDKLCSAHGTVPARAIDGLSSSLCLDKDTGPVWVWVLPPFLLDFAALKVK